MFKIHHSGQEPSNYCIHPFNICCNHLSFDLLYMLVTLVTKRDIEREESQTNRDRHYLWRKLPSCKLTITVHAILQYESLRNQATAMKQRYEERIAELEEEGETKAAKQQQLMQQLQQTRQQLQQQEQKQQQPAAAASGASTSADVATEVGGGLSSVD